MSLTVTKEEIWDTSEQQKFDDNFSLGGREKYDK